MGRVDSATGPGSICTKNRGNSVKTSADCIIGGDCISLSTSLDAREAVKSNLKGVSSFIFCLLPVYVSSISTIQPSGILWLLE